jgi:hypothetical protein
MTNNDRMTVLGSPEPDFETILSRCPQLRDAPA